MRFSLKTLLITLVLFAALIGYVINDMSSERFYHGSDGNYVRFQTEQDAVLAQSLEIEFPVGTLMVRIVRSEFGIADFGNDVIRYDITFSGSVRLSILAQTRIWPLTRAEFRKRIENEIQLELGLPSPPDLFDSLMPQDLDN